MTDSEGPQRRLLGPQRVFPGSRVITRVEGGLSGIEIFVGVRHIVRRGLFGLRLLGGSERLARVTHLLHRRAGTGGERREETGQHDETRGADRDVSCSIQGKHRDALGRY